MKLLYIGVRRTTPKQNRAHPPSRCAKPGHSPHLGTILLFFPFLVRRRGWVLDSVAMLVRPAKRIS